MRRYHPKHLRGIVAFADASKNRERGMEYFQCDGCGRQMKRGELRYTVKIDVKAAYDEMEVGLADLVRNHRNEMLDLIKRLEETSSPEEIEQTIYKHFRLDLCPACQQAYIKDPLRFRTQQTAEQSQTASEVDRFLRSLGLGEA